MRPCPFMPDENAEYATERPFGDHAGQDWASPGPLSGTGDFPESFVRNAFMDSFMYAISVIGSDR